MLTKISFPVRHKSQFRQRAKALAAISGAGLRCCSLLLFIAVAFGAFADLAAQSNAPTKTQSPSKPPGASSATGSSAAHSNASRSATDSADQELLLRLEAQHAAIKSGDAATVEQASRKVTALALREMASLRAIEGAWPQAIALYRQSLDLEDSNSVRVDLAVAYMTSDKPDNAIDETEKVLITEPKNARAWHVKAKALMAKNKYKEAVDALRTSEQLEPDANTQYALAFSLLKLKQKEQAEAVFKSMLQSYGDRAIWHEVFGGAYRETKYLDDAIKEFKRAIELDPTLPHIYAFLGEVMLEQNYWAPNPQILDAFNEEVKRYPKGYFGHYYLGVLESQQDNLADANQHLKIAIEADPQNPDPWLYLGLNEFKTRDYDRAKPDLLKAVELTGDDQARANYQIRRAYIALGRILVNEGKKPEAEVYLTKAKDLSGKSLAVSTSVIGSEMAESGMTSAPAVIPNATLPETEIQQNTAPVDTTAALGTGMLAKQHLPPAQVQAAEKREKELRAILSNSFNDWGTAEAREKNYSDALGKFQEAEKWDDSTPGLMRNVGLAALRTGNNAEAVRAFQAALQKDPNDQLARNMLPVALFSNQQFAEAAKAFDSVGDAVYRDPRMAYAWAFSLAHADDLKKADEVLTRLSEQQLPPDMLMAVGTLYSQIGNYEHALTSFQKAAALDPSLPRAHYQAGLALIHLDRPADAISEFQAELKMAPADVDTQYHLAYALLQTSQKDQAVTLLNTVIAEHPEHAQAQYELGKTLLDSGQLSEAIPHLEAAAKLDPDKDYIHYQLQVAYRKAGRTADADSEAKIYRDLKSKQRDQSNLKSAH